PKPPWTKAFTSAADVTLSAAVTAFLVLGVAALLTGGSVEGSAFSLKRLSSLFTSPAPLAARDVSNGLYDTRVGRPLFYVRGEVVNQGKTPQRARVRAEILEDDQLVRAAEGSAGNAASPEDLYGVSSGADVEALQARLEAAPAFIPPGGTASFLVPFYEYPPDPSRFRLRLSVWNPEAPPKAAASR
ncbi:MAG TPA: hypothetical protein VEY30_06360, partial [Myxococcaceae bacterium]|nr:hypothetical protein [Myxococcaceae bacterium]